MTIQIAPSILSADFCNLERDLKAISNADLVHVDVMDHHFVPNLTLGEPIVARICEVTDLPVDVHLMIEDPDRWAPEYAKLGAASVSFHMGATHAPVRLARQLREMGCKACFAVRPAEPVEPIFDILDEFDMILIMTVEPPASVARSSLTTRWPRYVVCVTRLPVAASPPRFRSMAVSARRPRTL